MASWVKRAKFSICTHIQIGRHSIENQDIQKDWLLSYLANYGATMNLILSILLFSLLSFSQECHYRKIYMGTVVFAKSKAQRVTSSYKRGHTRIPRISLFPCFKTMGSSTPYFWTCTSFSRSHCYSYFWGFIFHSSFKFQSAHIKETQFGLPKPWSN